MSEVVALEGFIAAMPADDVPVGGMRAITVEGVPVLVINLAGAFYAVENRCSHADSRLDGGRLRMGRIACPLHGAMFDVRTGASRSGNLVRTGLRTFATQLHAGIIHIAREAAPALNEPMT